MTAAVAAAAPGTSDIPGYDGMTPEQQCEAVRARDHQLWLDMVAQLPPGTPPPPEYVNPCVPEDPSFAPGAQEDNPTTDGTETTGIGGNQPGPSVGTNAPTDIPVAPPGAVIVPVPEHPPESTAPLPGDTTAPQDAPAPEAHVQPGSESDPAAPVGPNNRSAPRTADEPAGGTGAEPGTQGTPSTANDGGAVPPPQVEPSGGDEEPAPAEKLLLLLIGLAGAIKGAPRFRTRHLARFSRKDAALSLPSIGPADGKWVRDPNPLPSKDLPYGPFADEYIKLDEPIYGGWSSQIRAGDTMDQTMGDVYVQYRFRIVSMTAQEVHVVEDGGQYYKETYYSYNYEMMKSTVVQQNVAGKSALYPLPSEWEYIDAATMHEIIRSNPDAQFYVPSAR